MPQLEGLRAFANAICRFSCLLGSKRRFDEFRRCSAGRTAKTYGIFVQTADAFAGRTKAADRPRPAFAADSNAAPGDVFRNRPLESTLPPSASAFLSDRLALLSFLGRCRFAPRIDASKFDRLHRQNRFEAELNAPARSSAKALNLRTPASSSRSSAAAVDVPHAAIESETAERFGRAYLAPRVIHASDHPRRFA